MRKSNRNLQPGGIIILKRIGKREWIFSYPRLTAEVYDRLDVAIDWIGQDARRARAQFCQLIEEYPEFVDAYHHLALTWDRQGKKDKAAGLWKQGIEFAWKLFPPSFSLKRDRLIWGFLENRPFLRLYHSYGLSLRDQGKVEEALQVFENILSLNPNDNQGARALVVECNFRLKRPQEVLTLCNRYKRDAMEEILYGRVLALLQLGKLDEAAKALKRAVKYLPLVANELVKPSHRRPKDYSEKHVTLWTEGQAYGYWKEFGEYWSNTPGAIEFVRGCIGGGAKRDS